MFPYFNDDFFVFTPNFTQTLFNQDVLPSVRYHPSMNNSGDTVSFLRQSMTDFFRQTAAAFMSDIDSISCPTNEDFRNNPINICQRRIYHRQRRLQEYEMNTRRRSTPPPAPSWSSSRRAMQYLDQLPITTVRVREINHNNPGNNKQIGDANSGPEEAYHSEMPSNTLEYSLSMDRKAKHRLLHLIPLQPLSIGPNGRKPECDICLSEYESGHKLRHLPCGHGFHRDCIDTWLGTAETCPKCRKNVVGCLRRLQMKEARARSQSIFKAPVASATLKPLPSLHIPSTSASITTDSSLTTKPRNPVSVTQTRSSILRNQLAEQRRAAEVQLTSVSATRLHGARGSKWGSQASKLSLSRAASTPPTNLRKDSGPTDAVSATISDSGPADAFAPPATDASSPLTTLPTPAIQQSFDINDKWINEKEVSEGAREKAVEAALRRYECARQTATE